MREKAGAVLTEEVPAEAGGKWGTGVDAGAWAQGRGRRGVGSGAWTQGCVLRVVGAVEWTQGRGRRRVGAVEWTQGRGCRSSCEGGGWCGGSRGRTAGGSRKG